MNKENKFESIVIPVLAEKNVELPFYGSDGAAGADVRAFINEDILINPGDTCLVSTGLRFEIPEGYEIQVRPRSGLAFNYGVTVLNAPGTIDHDYRGELKVILINHGKETFVVKNGMRIAQLIVAPVLRARFIETSNLSPSSRGNNGFGSTGVS